MLISTINHCGEVINTGPSRWKCSSSCDSGWEAVGFDDSAWPEAIQIGVNGNPPCKHTYYAFEVIRSRKGLK